MVSEPTVDEILEKAKQLCRLDGMLWSNLDFLNPMAQQSGKARLAGVADRKRYLKRAQTLLERARYVVMKRPPLGGHSALGRGFEG